MKDNNNKPADELKCPKCGSINVEDQGHRFGMGSSKVNWNIASYKCNKCGNIFTRKL